MSQTDILHLLKTKGWMLSQEIKSELTIGNGATNRVLKKLQNYKLIITKPAKEVIKEKSRLGRTSPVALAYNITDSAKKYFK